MTHRTVEGSPESESRITPDAPASPAPPQGEREALSIALDALDEIALAGMSGTGMESEEAMRDWHARQAWKFIGIAARAKDAARASLRASPAVPVAQDERALFEASLGDGLKHEQGEFALARAHDKRATYTFLATRWAWMGWQVGRAALSASTQPAVSADERLRELNRAGHLSDYGLSTLLLAAAQPAVSAEARDTERLEWLTRHISGKALREAGVVWPAWSMENARAAIDAAMAPPADNKENGNGR